MAEKKTRRRTKINFWRMGAALLAVVLIAMVAVSLGNILELHEEQRMLQEENRRLSQTKADLSAELANVNDPEYIEEQARKQLKMIRPGEVLYVIDSGDSGEGEDENEGGNAD